MDFSDAPKIIANKIKPRNLEERILKMAYDMAKEGHSLLHLYSNIDELCPITEDKLKGLVLGYSSGSKIYQFLSENERKSLKLSKLS